MPSLRFAKSPSAFRPASIFALGVLFLTPLFSQTPPPRDEVIAIVRRSAAAEIALQKQSAERPLPGVHRIGNDWASATFFVGAMQLAERTDAPDVLAFCLGVAEKLNHAHRYGRAPVHLVNADDMAIGDLYQHVHLRTGAIGALLPLKQRMDFTAPYLRMEPKPERLVWWWCDALFMAPPVWARMSAITGAPDYIDAMDAQWWRVYSRLYDKDERLFTRDERFLARRSPNGNKIFWSRGQGWVLAGLARLLELMPADYPSRPRYIAVFQEMSARIATLQHEDGLWRASLLDADAFPEPETSGTALLAYALAFGVNHGLLDREEYLPRVLKAWDGLGRFVLPNGILGQVQKTGDQPVATTRETTALYASGAFILAGLEVADLTLPASPLPLPVRQAPRTKFDAANWSARPLPAQPSADQLKEHDRDEAERRAVAELSFDPDTDDPAFVSPLRNRAR